MEKLNLTQEWDKVFPKSDKVDHKKVTFHNRYGITLAADMYTPKGAEGKLPAIAVSGPFGAVKEQSSGLYAQKMAELGFLTIAFDPSYTGESGGTPRYSILFLKKKWRHWQMNTALSKKFFSYVIPSVLAFALSGVYTIVDGFFIGQSLGNTGLAAITLGYRRSAVYEPTILVEEVQGGYRGKYSGFHPEGKNGGSKTPPPLFG